MCIHYRIQISRVYYKISNHAVGLSSAQYLRICRACERLQGYVAQKTWMLGGIPSSMTHTRGDMYPPPSPLELENLSILHKDMFNGNPRVALWTRWAWLSHNRPRCLTPQTQYGTYHRGTLSKLSSFHFYIRFQYFHLLGKCYCGISKVTSIIPNNHISWIHRKDFTDRFNCTYLIGHIMRKTI